MAKATLRAACVLGICVMLASLIAGCGGKSPDDVVATVNGVPITVGYFEVKWAKLASNDGDFEPTPANADSMRRAVLKVLINKELMVDRAKQENYVGDPVYLDAYENQKNYRLIELLKNKQVVDRMPTFTEEDFQEHYQYVGLSVKARHIDVDTEEQGAAVVAEIKAEEISFGDAVLKYSTHNDRKTGGNLGAVRFGQNIKPVEDALFHMAQGDVSDPIRTPYGWSIFIADEITQGKQDEYASVRESIKHRLEMRSLREVGGKHAEDVLEKYGFKFHWDIAEVVLGYMPDDLTPSQASEARSRTEEKPVLKFTEDELALVLYELDGQNVTLQDYSDEYDRLHPYARPQKAARLQGIYNTIHKDAVGKVMPKEAIAIGLDKDPELIMAMKEFEEQSCIGAVRRVLVNREISMTDEEQLAFYEENPLYYTLKPQVRCKQIINSEEAKIQDAARRLQAGETFDAVGSDISIVFNRQWISDWFTPDSTAAPGNTAIAIIQRLDEVGKYTDPFFFQGYWGIMQLHEIQDARLMPFEEARDRVEKDLREKKENDRLDQLLSEWRDEVPVEINEKVLAKIVKGEAPNPNRGRF
jgi:peptidyl-prolyl cis-trans isomerase C